MLYEHFVSQITWTDIQTFTGVFAEKHVRKHLKAKEMRWLIL